MKTKWKSFIGCLALVLVLSALPGLIFDAFAEAPMVKTQVPAYYRMMLGQFEITALADGFLDTDVKLMQNISEAAARKLLYRHFSDSKKTRTAVNCYLINTGSKLILVDPGAGSMFGPALGKMFFNLKAAGYAPAQIDTVLITHMHPDHIGGLIDANGKAAFAKADVYVAKAESDFWLSELEAKKVPAEMRKFFDMARAAAAPYMETGRWKTVQGTDLPVAGIRAVPVHGHTAGHTAYEVRSGGDTLLIIGDMVHNMAIQFPQPEAAILFDKDIEQAVKARQETFRKAAETRSTIAGMHIPFPGIGHIRAEGKGSYTWVPVEFSPLP